MNWWEYNEEDRIKNVYSKYTIKDFFNFWSNNSLKFMEIRIKDYNIIKEIANRFYLPYSLSGVYIKNDIELKNVISFLRKFNVTCWYSINSRKKNYNQWGNKNFSGKNYNVDEINHLFIDIDRILKQSPATNEELKNCDILADKILEKLGTEGWNKSYMKICSGNGVQILIKLDIPIRLPNIIFDSETKTFISNNEFEEFKQLISNGIGKEIIKFSNKFKDELKVEVDKASFKISGVGALPVTKNFKYNSFTWRGIIEIKNGENIGLSDYALSKIEDIKLFREKNVFKTRKSLFYKNRIKVGELDKNPIVRLILDNDLPFGEINNKLWFQLKALLRDSKFDLNSNEFKRVHALLEKKLKGNLSTNLPEKKFEFNEDVVNSYCIDYCLPLIYPLWQNRTKKLDMKLEGLNWEEIYITTEKIELNKDTSIQEDIREYKKVLISGDYNNIPKIGKFINGCIQKYGEKKTKYYFKFLFNKGFNYE